MYPLRFHTDEASYLKLGTQIHNDSYCKSLKAARRVLKQHKENNESINHNTIQPTPKLRTKLTHLVTKIATISLQVGRTVSSRS